MCDGYWQPLLYMNQLNSLASVSLLRCNFFHPDFLQSQNILMSLAAF